MRWLIVLWILVWSAMVGLGRSAHMKKKTLSGAGSL
jgi:hypothetical protein